MVIILKTPEQLEAELQERDRKIEELKSKLKDLSYYGNKDYQFRTLVTMINEVKTKNLDPAHKVVLQCIYYRIIFGKGEKRNGYRRVLTNEIIRNNGGLVKTDKIIQKLLQLSLVLYMPGMEMLPDEYWLSIPEINDLRKSLTGSLPERRYGMAWCPECKKYERNPRTYGRGVKVTVCSKGHIIKGPTAYSFKASLAGVDTEDIPMYETLQSVANELMREITEENNKSVASPYTEEIDFSHAPNVIPIRSREEKEELTQPITSYSTPLFCRKCGQDTSDNWREVIAGSGRYECLSCGNHQNGIAAS